MSVLNDGEKIDQIKSRLPTKLKIIAEAWNPVLELLALALDNGKIMAKAIDRKTCWKRSLAEDDGIIKNIWKTPSGGTFEIRSMAWSPDGEILAVSMDNGCIHMLTAASGKIGYTVDGCEPYEKLVWEKICSQQTDEIKDASLSFATASSFDFNDEAPKECAQQIADMEDFFHQHFYSFYGTVLFGVTESAVLNLYIAGIMHCHKLNVMHHHEFGPNSDVHSLQVLDCIVNDETKNVEVLYQITEMEETSGIVNNTFLFKYDLGWSRETFGTLSVIAASFFKINYLLIFLREIVRYTAHGLEESTENLYQKVIRMFYSNYKMTQNAPWSFFHEMMQHLCGNTVSLAYFDSLRKARSGTSGPLHYAKLINEYNEKRLGALDTGIQRIALAIETIIGLYRCITDSYSQDFSYVQPNNGEPPKMDKNTGLNHLISCYCDLVVFQKLIETIRIVIDKKRLGFQYLAYYITQVNTKNEENFPRAQLTVFLENINLAAFCDFIGESMIRSDVRIPTSILSNILAKVPSLEDPPKTLQAFRNIADTVVPFGCYPLPRMVAVCCNRCPHNSKYLNGESEPVAFQLNTSIHEVLNDNPRRTNPLVSVYLWRTERYFDFFSKFFPEYGFAKYPPEAMSKLMEEKLKLLMEDEKIRSSLELIFGKEKHSLIYDVNKTEYMSKMALRPTVFLALMPLFSFEKKIVEIISDQYPSYIHAEKVDYKGDRLQRQRSTNSDNIEAIVAACTEILDDEDNDENRWTCDSPSVFVVQDSFLASTRDYLMGYES